MTDFKDCLTIILWTGIKYSGITIICLRVSFVRLHNQCIGCGMSTKWSVECESSYFSLFASLETYKKFVIHCTYSSMQYNAFKVLFNQWVVGPIVSILTPRIHQAAYEQHEMQNCSAKSTGPDLFLSRNLGEKLLCLTKCARVCEGLLLLLLLLLHPSTHFSGAHKPLS